MKAIILAGGGGTRLELSDIPKPMYKLSGKPILEHNILLLKKHKITDICMALHHRYKVVREYFGDGSKWHVNIDYSIEDEPFGTSGGIKEASWFVDNEPFLVVYGDNYTDIDLTRMLDTHFESKPDVTIAVFDPEKSVNCRIAGGLVNVDQNNTILSFTEGKSNNNEGNKGYVNAGVYVLEKKILDTIAPKRISDFGRDIFPKLLMDGYKLKAYHTSGFVLAIDTKEALSIAEEIISKTNVGN